MKKYCLDTSGLSTPLEQMPEDIHVSLWGRVTSIITAGHMATTQEVYDELTHLTGSIGECIRASHAALVLEVGQPSWASESYIGHNSRMLVEHHDFIYQFIGGSKRTVGINDISIVALGKALSLPVISSETRCSHQTRNKRKIPDVCLIEHVLPISFNDFLRAEGIAV